MTDIVAAISYETLFNLKEGVDEIQINMTEISESHLLLPVNTSQSISQEASFSNIKRSCTDQEVSNISAAR